MSGHFKQRIEARAATLEPGVWRTARCPRQRIGHPCRPSIAVYQLKTSLTPEQVRESFATPEIVPFWELPKYITIAEHAGLGRRRL